MKKVSIEVREELGKVFGNNKPIVYDNLYELLDSDNRIYVNVFPSKEKQTRMVVSNLFYKPISRCIDE